jgi:hypothetical protein
MTGCDPCPSCKPTLIGSTVEVLRTVSVTDPQGNQLTVTGVPVNLSQISK